MKQEHGTFILISHSSQLSKNNGEILKYTKNDPRDFTRIIIPAFD